MTPEVEVDALLETLKRVLRERGITYATIASALDVSLPTVKRLLNKDDIPLATLARIAAMVDLSIAELASRAEKPTITFFDEEQDALFFERPEMLAYFLRLEAGETPQQIAREHGLSEASTTLYLSTLDRARLVEMLPGNRARLLVRSPCGFSRSSKTMARDLRATVDRIADSVFAKFHAPEGDMILVKPMRLSADAYRELRAELRATIERYAALSARATSGETYVVALLCDRFAEQPQPIPELTKR